MPHKTKAPTDAEQRVDLIARCYVALAEVDYDLRAWSDEVYVRSVIDGRGHLSDFEQVAA